MTPWPWWKRFIYYWLFVLAVHIVASFCPEEEKWSKS